MGTAFVRRAAGMHDCQAPLLPGRKQRRQAGMQTEKAIEVEGPQTCSGATVVGARDRQGWAQRIVRFLSVRHNHVEHVGRTAQEDDHQHVPAWWRILRSEREPWHPCRPRHGGG